MKRSVTPRRWRAGIFVCLLAGASMAPVVIPSDAQWLPNGKRILYTTPSHTNVGLGTKTPLARIHVATGVDAAPAEGRNGYVFLRGRAGPANLILDNNEIMARWGYEPGTLYLQHEGGEIQIHAGAQGDPVRVTESGQLIVGDGNSQHPDYEVQVEGAIVAQEVRVTMDGWADAVLAEDADPSELRDLERFIRREGHLPGIPTEAEAVRDGVSVGEVTRGLLERVERLTLHTIRQEEELARLRREVRRLCRHAEKGACDHGSAN